MTASLHSPNSTAHIHSSLFGSDFYLPPLHSILPSPAFPSPPPYQYPLHKTCDNMLLGKRPRPPMKRTTSLSEIPLDLNVAPDAPPNDPNYNPNGRPSSDVPRKHPGVSNWLDQRVSPASRRRHSMDPVQTADFLRACFLCKRRLIPGRDIYMYRGDSAFCSLECRQQKMIQDERKEKRRVVSNKQAVAPPSESQVSAEGESVAVL